MSETLINLGKIIESERKKIHISLSKKLIEILNNIIEYEGLETEGGEKYPLSYLIEDMILWILSDSKRYEQFINDNFEEVEE